MHGVASAAVVGRFVGLSKKRQIKSNSCDSFGDYAQTDRMCGAEGTFVDNMGSTP